MVAKTANFSPLLAPGLRKIFDADVDGYEEQYSKYFNVVGTERAYEDDYQMSGFPIAATKPEGIGVAYYDPISGATKRYTPVPFGIGFRVTYEMYINDLYGPIRKAPRLLKFSMNQRVEIDAANLYTQAFGTTLSAGFDGLSLFNTAHTLLRGGTYANRPTVEADLSVTSLQAATEAFEGTVNEDNLLIGARAQMLVIPRQLKWIAREILGSPGAPYTSDNQINSLREEGFTHSIWQYLTDPDMWFLLGPKAQHAINFFWRVKPKFDNSDDFDSGDAKFKGYMNYTLGHSDWRGAYGTQGA